MNSKKGARNRWPITIDARRNEGSEEPSPAAEQLASSWWQQGEVRRVHAPHRMVGRYPWTQEDLSQVPERPGVYTVYGFIQGDRMYHGQAANLRERLLQHFYAADIGFFPAYATVTVVSNPLRRGRIERERIERDRPRYNRQLNPNYRE